MSSGRFSRKNPLHGSAAADVLGLSVSFQSLKNKSTSAQLKGEEKTRRSRSRQLGHAGPTAQSRSLDIAQLCPTEMHKTKTLPRNCRQSILIAGLGTGKPLAWPASEASCVVACRRALEHVGFAARALGISNLLTRQVASFKPQCASGLAGASKPGKSTICSAAVVDFSANCGKVTSWIFLLARILEAADAS